MNIPSVKPRVIEASKRGLPIDLIELAKYRELIFFLAWRDIKVRYKQTALGILWVILQPLATMFIFSVVFGSWLNLPSSGIPYPIFTLVALLPWQLFSYALTNSSVSLIGDQNLIRKVYFPRVIIPISSILSGIVDFLITLILVLGTIIVFGGELSLRILLFPLYTAMVLICALGVGLWLSALSVQYRDVRYVLPFLNQIWMYATPIAYSSDLIPAKWRLVFSINPMVSIVEGFRWMFFDTGRQDLATLLLSLGIILLLFVSGLFYFNKMEDYFADLI